MKKNIKRKIICSLVLLVLTGCQKEQFEQVIEVDNPPNQIEVELENTITPEPLKEVSIIMVGDNLLHDRIYESGLSENGDYNYDHLYVNTKEIISDYDIAIVNQEVILGGLDLGLSGYPLFNGGYEIADSLVNAGFDIICHSTNHSIDQGSIGVENCLNNWTSKYPDIGIVGINLSFEQQDEIYIKEVNGIKIAILNYTYGLNGLSMPSSKEYLVNMLDESEVKKDIIEAEQIADFTIVCPHWGTEYTHSESSYQVNWANFMVDLGADLIIGTHPHVIQPVRWVESENGNKALVYYSLGNFINATNQYGDVSKRMLGEMATINIVNENGSTEIVDYDAIPIVSHIDVDPKETTVYLLSDYTNELAERNLIKYQDSKFSLDYLNNLWDDMIVE